jgi:hypothetical protein
VFALPQRRLTLFTEWSPRNMTRTPPWSDVNRHPVRARDV